MAITTYSNQRLDSQAPKILFHVSRYWPATTGAALHTREIIQHLQHQHQIGVIRHCADESCSKEIALTQHKSNTLMDGKIPIYQVAPNEPWRRSIQYFSRYYSNYRLSRPIYHNLFCVSVASQLRQIVPNYQLLHAVYSGLTCSVEAVVKIAKQLRLPFVLTPLPHITSGKEVLAPSLRRLYQRADALIAMTSFERDWLIGQNLNADLIHICPIGPLVAKEANPAEFRQQHQLGDNPIVLFIGRQVSYKGYQQVCEAAARVWSEQPETRFVFLGPHTEASATYFTQQSDRRIVNLGKVSLAVKTSALAACDILCVPSIQESLGGIYLEAWLHKKPVIAADIPAMQSVIADGEDGLIIEQNAKAIATSLRQLLKDPLARKQMGESGYAKVRKNYDWNFLAERLQTIYQNLLSRSSCENK